MVGRKSSLLTGRNPLQNEAHVAAAILRNRLGVMGERQDKICTVEERPRLIMTNV